MKKLYIIIILLLNALGFSQKNELGKVTVEQLQEKKSAIDTSAAAAILFKKCTIRYDGVSGQAIIETEIKLKIYKKEGYDYANLSESYFNKNGESVNFSDAYTYNLLNGQIIKTKVKKESEFKEKLTKDIDIKKLAFSDVKEGSIIEYKIKRYSNNTFRLVNFYFQEDIPVNDVELTVYYPERLFYNKNQTGYLIPQVSDQKTSNGENKCNYKLKNVLALKDEGYVNNINNYRTRIRYELASVKNSWGVSENISTDWQTVVKRIYESEYFGEELKKKGYFEDEINNLLKGLISQDEKIRAIFNYVKTRMIWSEENGITCNEGVKTAFQNKKGNVAEINLIMTAMMRYAGLDANPVLVSTRSNGISFFPTIVAFNYVICAVELNNEVTLLDATEKNALPNILPIRDLNWFGRIIRKDGSSAIIDLMPKSNSKDVVSIMGNINIEGEITGKIREQYFDYNAFVYRVSNKDLDKDSYIEKLEKRYHGLEIVEYDAQNKNDLSQPVVENYDFKTSNSVEIIGDKMYFSPFLFFAARENPFKQEVREYPVDFVYPNQDKYTVSIKIPEGYAIETLPKSANISLPENLGNFRYIISNNADQIQLLYTQDINQAIIGSEYYDALKGFFKEILNKQTEKVVLKKV